MVRNYSEFVEAIINHSHQITHISFDHDLADEHYNPAMLKSEAEYNALQKTFKEKTGFDCALFVKDFYIKKNQPLPQLIVHSMNPVGTKNILNLFIPAKNNQA